MDAFTSLEACIRARSARLDPLVGDALSALGYETLVGDACRIVAAIKDGTVEPCASLDASALRRRCRTLVALASATPEHCPLHRPGHPSDGRDPVCLAAATGDVRLCGAASPVERATCEAVVLRDERVCRPAGALAAACTREVKRVARLGEAGKARPALATSLVPTAEGHPVGAPPEVQASLARGVVLEGRGKAFRTVLAPPPRAVVAAIGLADTFVELELLLTPGDPPKAVVSRGTVAAPGTGRVVCPGPACALRVESVEGGFTRGAPLHLRLEGTLRGAAGTVPVTLDVATFVRDVVDGPALLREE